MEKNENKDLKFYLIVYEELYSFETSMYGYSTSNTHYYTRLKSGHVKAKNRIEAYNKACDSLKAQNSNGQIVHIEELD